MRSLSSTQYLKASAVAAAAVLTLVPVGDAGAQESDPQTSQWVDSASVLVDPNHQIEDLTVLTGIDECQSLAGSETIVDASFQTNVAIDNNDHFGGVYHYGRDRRATPVQCVDEDGQLHEDCTEIDEEELEFSGTPANEVSATVQFGELSELTTEDCEAGEQDRIYSIQLRVRGRDQTTGELREWEQSEVRVVSDLIRPDTPSLSDVMATENSISVEFDRAGADDVDNHAVVYSRQSFEEGDRVEDVMSRAPLTIGGEEPVSGQVNADLEPDSTVYVGLVSRDRAGNFSPVSAPMETTVVDTTGFWDVYVEQGGDEQGGYGCSTAGGGGTAGWGLLLMMVALAVRLVGRRNERASCEVPEREGGRR